MPTTSSTSPSAAPSQRWLAGVVALAVLLVAAAAAVLHRDQRHAEARADLAAEVGGAAADVASVLAEQFDAAVVTAAALLGERPVDGDAVRLRPSAPTSATTLARDRGEPVLVTGAGGLPTESLALLVPIYAAPDGAATAVPPADTDTRREQADGFVLVDLRRPLDEALDERRHEGELALVADDQIVAGVPGSGALEAKIPVTEGVDLVGTRPGPGVGAPLAVLLLGAGLAAGAALAIRRGQRTVATIRGGRDHAHRDLELITSVAPIVQQSLELGDVLPAAAIAMSDAFGLRGVAVSIHSGGSEIELFATGRVPGRPAQSRVPTRIAADEVVALSLERGGRQLGVLRILAGAALDQHQVQVLLLLGDLVAAAVANAGLFAQQQAAVARLRDVDELKTVFLATASHELRTPVTAIGGFASVLTRNWDDFDDDDRRRFAERIAVNASSLEQLVGQLLDFSRVEGGGADAGSPMDLDAFVTTLAPVLESQVPDHTLVVHHTHDCYVRGTEGAIERIVTNLVSNAAKYSPSGTQIDVRVAATDDEVVLVVDDEGSGVAPEDRERIFSRFFRGAGEEVTRTRGAGVGLAVVADFARSMDGTVHVEDGPAGGARFVVRFPRLGASDLADATTMEADHVD